MKGLSPQEFAARNDLALALTDRINAIPDGTPAVPKQTTGGWASSTTTRADIKFDSGKCLISSVALIDGVPKRKGYICRMI